MIANLVIAPSLGRTLTLSPLLTHSLSLPQAARKSDMGIEFVWNVSWVKTCQSRLVYMFFYLFINTLVTFLITFWWLFFNYTQVVMRSNGNF